MLACEDERSQAEPVTAEVDVIRRATNVKRASCRTQHVTVLLTEVSLLAGLFET
jgi:hypothetical protein